MALMLNVRSYEPVSPLVLCRIERDGVCDPTSLYVSIALVETNPIRVPWRAPPH